MADDDDDYDVGELNNVDGFLVADESLLVGNSTCLWILLECINSKARQYGIAVSLVQILKL